MPRICRRKSRTLAEMLQCRRRRSVAGRGRRSSRSSAATRRRWARRWATISTRRSTQARRIHWRGLPPLRWRSALPEGAQPLARFRAAPQALARRLAQIGVVFTMPRPGACRRNCARPAAVSPRGRSVALGRLYRAPTRRRAAAQRLAQRNRLAELDAEMPSSAAIAAEAAADVRSGQAVGRRRHAGRARTARGLARRRHQRLTSPRRRWPGRAATAERAGSDAARWTKRSPPHRAVARRSARAVSKQAQCRIRRRIPI